MFEAVGSYAAGTMSDDEENLEYESTCPTVRFLLRHVYRKLHELPDRSARYGTAWQRNDSRRYILQRIKLAKHAGHGSYGAAAETISVHEIS